MRVRGWREREREREREIMCERERDRVSKSARGSARVSENCTRFRVWGFGRQVWVSGFRVQGPTVPDPSDVICSNTMPGLGFRV